MDSNDTNKLDLKSLDIAEDKIKTLKKLFPEIVTENKVDFEKLKATLGNEIEVGKERYGMNWPGKANCFKIIQEPSIGTLKPVEEDSVDFDTTENLFIEGDSLEVLKLLQKSYYEKIKMIYIDPPYNTGNDFIYPDNYSETLDTYLRYTGQKGETGLKLTSNTETEGRYHSKWINMIYPRLFLARNLLKEDGVIFMSIDDHEVDNLKKICNEIFGEENFRGIITIQGNPRGRDYGGIARMHDYLIVYTKQEETEINDLLDPDKVFPFSDHNGGFEIRELRNRNIAFHQGNRPNLYYPFYINPKSTLDNDFHEISLDPVDNWFKLFPKESQGFKTVWRWGKILAKKNLNLEIVGKKMEDGGYQIVEKYRKKTKMARSIWTDKDVNTEKGTLQVKQLFDGFKIFDFPKPMEMIKRIVEMGTSDFESDIVLDFFAGSATTAHSVLELNKSTKGNRKFIMVQLQEPTLKESIAYQKGFMNIAEIGKERIRRVIKKMNENNIDHNQETKIMDLGFKVLRLDESNFNTWDKKSNKPLTEQLQLSIHNISDNSSDEDILYEIILKSGYSLTVSMQKLEIQGKTVYSVDENTLLVCLENDLNQDLMKELSKLEAGRVICLDRGFNGSDELKTNTVEIMKTRGIEFKTV